MLEPLDSDVQDREPLENARNSRSERVTPERDGRFFWQLAAGEWNMRAVSRKTFAEQKNCRRKLKQLAPSLFARLRLEDL